ncbi:uncharacterized protein KY384_000336 [Bacidia gigantensis]|uniref:uncharacterized protein n=1 Tax=Bacidia gigantensis TaxID=2732470 RepID=UPI001D044840|nr:uncharacterized protein KY384_000336 [Bacidia gigantensis]KAG8526343.1 hypothetical protein KY384_000336 [Bacidia gigantensis]
MSESPSQSGLPSDARTIQWAPNVPAVTGSGKPGQGSIGACDACRSRKVRCLASENSQSSKCQRCARAGRECVYTVHSKTRRRKRTDTRVKELEEKVKNLSVLLEQGRSGGGLSTLPTKDQLGIDLDEGMEDEYEDVTDEENEEDELQIQDAAPSSMGAQSQKLRPPSQNRKSSANTSQSPNHQGQSSFTVPGFYDGTSLGDAGHRSDVVDRGLLSMKEATELYERYVNVLAPLYPSVIIPYGTPAIEVRESRPIL